MARLVGLLFLGAVFVAFGMGVALCAFGRPIEGMAVVSGAMIVLTGVLGE